MLDVESIPPLIVDTLPELREPTGSGSPTLKAFAPVVFNGRIGKPREEDRYIVGVIPGQKYHIEVDAAELGSALDGVLQVKGPDGGVLATADDTAAPTQSKAKAAAKKAAAINSPDPSVDFTVPAGMLEITLTLRDLRGEGGDGYPYRLSVESVDAAPFQVTPVDDQINIPKGGTASVAVTVTRQGFNGPIKLTVANPPPGLTIRPGLVNAGQGVGTLTINASPVASFEVAQLKLVGEAQGTPNPVVVEGFEDDRLRRARHPGHQRAGPGRHARRDFPADGDHPGCAGLAGRTRPRLWGDGPDQGRPIGGDRGCRPDVRLDPPAPRLRHRTLDHRGQDE